MRTHRGFVLTACTMALLGSLGCAADQEATREQDTLPGAAVATETVSLAVEGMT